MNAITYILLRYPEVFGHNGMKPILVCEVDGGHGVSNKDEEALFSFVLLFIAFNLSMLIVYRHAPGQSALNVSERINGAQSKALSGCPIYLNLKDLHKASVDEIDEAMTAAQVEYIKRVHGQPCKKSTITAMVPPSHDSCMFSFSDVKSFLASGKPKIPLFEEAKRIINDPLLLKQSEYCLQIKKPNFVLQELIPWHGFFPGPFPSTTDPMKLARITETLNQSVVQQDFDYYRPAPFMKKEFELQQIFQKKILPELFLESQDYVEQFTRQDISSIENQWKLMKNKVESDLAANETEVSNRVNKIEEVVQAICSKPHVIQGKTVSVPDANKSSIVKLLQNIDPDLHVHTDMLRPNLVKALFERSNALGLNVNTELTSSVYTTALFRENQAVSFGLLMERGASTDYFFEVKGLLANTSAFTTDIHKGDILATVNGLSITTKLDKAAALRKFKKIADGKNMIICCFSRKK